MQSQLSHLESQNGSSHLEDLKCKRKIPSQEGFLRITKKTLVIIFTGVLIFTGSGLLYLFGPFAPKAEAAWFNDNWQYRQAITATVTSSSSDITNLETLITVNTSSLISTKLQSSCQDLRFTNTNGKLLPYYIDSGCNTTTTKIWVMADLVPKNTTTYTLYMYYGNPSAPAGSNSTMFDNVVGLKGYWTFNDNSGSTVTDSSVGADNGTWNGTLGSQWTTGQYGSAGNFNGTDNYVDAGNPSNLQITTNTITMEAWINPAVNVSSMSNWVGVVQKLNFGGSAASNAYGIVRWDNGSGKLLAYLYTSNGSCTGGCTLDSVTTFSANTWYHITVTYDGSTFSFYVNGSLTNSSSASGNINAGTNNLLIGKNRASPSEFWNGKIDDVHIYNTARTATQITNDFNNTSCGGQTCTIATTAVGTITPSTSFATEETTPSALAYWKFDEGFGTTTSDSTSNQATGTLAGITLPTWQTEDQCISGKCLFFDGSSSKVTVSKVVNNVQTVAMWVKPNSVSSSALIDLDGGTHKITVSSGTISATGFTSPTIYVNGVVSSTLTANTWNFVEVITGTGFNTTSSLTIANSSTTFFHGYIDEVKLYGYARSAAQVAADYNAAGNIEGLAEKQGNAKNLTSALNNGLVGYWKMDEASGNLTDSSGNGNTGTVTGTTVVAGKFGNGRSFNGTTDYASISDTTTLDPSKFTISFWMKENSEPTDFAHIISKLDSGTPNKGWVVVFNNVAPRKVYISLKDTSGNETNTTANLISLTIGTWTHITFTFDGSNIGVYTNGAQTATVSMPTTFQTSTTPLVFARASSFSGNFSPVTLDEVRYFNRALSPSDASNLYNFAQGPVGYWKFDEGSGSTVNDSSGNANTGTWNGTLGSQWTTGKYGKAGKFNGSNNYISTSNVPTTNQTNWTIGAWINPAALSVLDIAVSNGADDGTCASATTCNGYAFGVGNGAGLAGSKLQGLLPGVAWIDSGYTFASTNTWYYVVMESNSSGTISFYVNGVATSGTSTSAPKGAPNNFRIGGQSTAGRYFNGSVDEVKVYNYARSQQQIIEDMNAGHPPPGSPVGSAVGYWKFDEGYGTTANNSGNGGSTLNGTLTNMSSPATSTSGWTQSGKFGKALSFNGINNYVTIPSSSNLPTGSVMTVSAWIYPTAYGDATYNGIVSWGARTCTGTSMLLSIQNTGRLSMATWCNDFVPSTGPTATLNAWNYAAVVLNGTAVSLYLNGVLEASGTLASTPNVQAGVLNIGATDNPGRYFTGKIDEVKIYNFALTSAQILEDMNRGQAQVLGALSDNSSYQPQAANQEYCVPGDSSSCSAPVGRWDFEEGSGTSVNDSSGNANTGTWNGTLGSQWTTGKIGKAGNFNGSNNYVNAGNDSSLGITGNAITIEAWVKHTSSSFKGWEAIVTKGDSSYRLHLCGTASSCAGGGILNAFTLGLSGTSATIDTSGTTVPALNTWYFVVGTYGDSTAKIYVNGNLEGSQSKTGNIASDVYNVYLGENSQVTGRQWTGLEDNVRIFNYARSAAQIAWDFNRGLPVGYWKFDECQGTVAHDSSLNANNGTINIGASGTQTAVGTCTDGNSAHAWANGKTGKFNYSLNFDGTDDYVNAGNGSSLQITGQISISAWIKHGSIVGTSDIVSKEATSKGYYLWIDGTTKLIHFGFNQGAVEITSNRTVDTNWHHIVGTYDPNGGSNNTKIYIDGLLNQQATKTGTITDSGGNLAISSFTGGTTNFYTGQIDDVRIYNYALTSSQVKLLFNQGSGIRYGPTTGAP